MRVYVSLPLNGPVAEAARDLLRGVELAARDCELVVLDGPAAPNARRAAGDPEAVAYVGDFHSRDVFETAPVLGEAGLLQVAPVATHWDLRGPTLVRLSPHDGVGARAIAGWLAGAGARELLVVYDHDEGYGVPVGEMCVTAARERGIEVRSRPVWDHDQREADDVGSADAVLYVGAAGSGAIGLWHELHAVNPGLWLLGTDGVAVDWLAEALAPEAAARSRFFVAQRAPFGFYGYEAMALIRASVGADRAATVAAARGVRERDSVLGRYSLDAHGLISTTEYGRRAVVGGKLVWD